MAKAVIATVGAVLTTAWFGGLAAQEVETSPVQIALIAPVQIVGADKAITGLRWNILYGKNAYVVGLDVGLVNRTTTGVSRGLQHGIVNLVDADFQGWQDGGINITKGAFEGLQTGVVNSAGSSRGLQWGAVNVSDDHNGLQLGVVNYARRMHGLQIGLVNIISQNGAFPVFPIVNWSF